MGLTHNAHRADNYNDPIVTMTCRKRGAMRQVHIKNDSTYSGGDLAANIDSFRRHLAAENLSPRTLKVYTEAARLLEGFLADRGMPRDVANIRREHVEAFVADQLERLKPATASNRYRSLRALFKWLEEEGELPNGNPMMKMKPPRVPEQPPDILREDELKALLKTCEGKDYESRRDHAILRVFLDTGARVGEVTGIRWDPDDEENNDLDLDQGLLRILGKGGRWRLVHLGAKCIKALDRYLKLRGRHPHTDARWLWLGQKGRMTDSGIRQAVRRRGRQAGFAKQLYPHLLRHSFAHAWLHAGGGETDLMRVAGWRSRQMLERYGASAAQERSLTAAKRLALGDRI